MKLDRLQRLLLLVPLARRHGRAGIPVAEALAVLRLGSVDELLEDVDLLSMVGDPRGSPEAFVDIVVEDDRVKVFLPQGFSQPPRFNAVEAAAVLAALRPLEEAEVAPAAELVRKLRAALPGDVEGSAEVESALLARAARIEAGPASPFRADLEDAIRHKREVEVEYFSLADGTHSARRLWPRAVLLHQGRWYLCAWNLEKGAEHLYRLDRMSRVTPTGEHFSEHPGPSLSRYELDQLYVPTGREEEVVLRFGGKLAAHAESHWPEMARRHEDGSVTVRVQTSGDHFVLSWVLGYGGEAEILEPAHLREKLAARVEALRRQYA